MANLQNYLGPSLLAYDWSIDPSDDSSGDAMPYDFGAIANDRQAMQDVKSEMHPSLWPLFDAYDQSFGNLLYPPAPEARPHLLDQIRQQVAALPPPPQAAAPPASNLVYAPQNPEAPLSGNTPSDDPGFWDKVKARWQIGDSQAQDDQQAYRAAIGQIPWESGAPEIDNAERERAQGGNVFSEGLLSAIEAAPPMLRGTMAGAKEGVAVGSASGLLSELAGPEAVPFGAATGYEMGATHGSMLYWYRQGVGSFYHSLRRQGIPHNVASNVSQALGYPYAALQFAQVANLVPGLRSTTDALVGQTLRRALIRLATQKGRDYVNQIGQGELQQLLSLAGEKISQTISGVKPPPDQQGAWDRIKATAKQSAITTPFLMAPKIITEALPPVQHAPESFLLNDTKIAPNIKTGEQQNEAPQSKITIKVTNPIGKLREGGLKDAHHIIQDAAVRDLPGYDTNLAPGVQIRGPSTTIGSPHYYATQMQRTPGGGTYAAERRIAYIALKKAGYTSEQAIQAIHEADAYFQSIGVKFTTQTRIPGNRK